MKLCRFPALAAALSTTVLLAMDAPMGDAKAQGTQVVGAAAAAGAWDSVFGGEHDAALATAMNALEGLSLSSMAMYTNETGTTLKLILDRGKENQVGGVVACLDRAKVPLVLLSASGQKEILLLHGETVCLALSAEEGQSFVKKSFSLVLDDKHWGHLHLAVDQDDELSLGIS